MMHFSKLKNGDTEGKIQSSGGQPQKIRAFPKEDAVKRESNRVNQGALKNSIFTGKKRDACAGPFKSGEKDLGAQKAPNRNRQGGPGGQRRGNRREGRRNLFWNGKDKEAGGKTGYLQCVSHAHKKESNGVEHFSPLHRKPMGQASKCGCGRRKRQK